MYIDALIMYKGIRTMNQLSIGDEGNDVDDVTILYIAGVPSWIKRQTCFTT